MAVEIPVVVDIEGAFKDAAARVGVAMKPLKQAVTDKGVLELKFKTTIPEDQLKNFSKEIQATAKDAGDGFKIIERSFEQLWENGKPKLDDIRSALASFKQQLNAKWNNGKMDDIEVPNLQKAIILMEDYLNNRNRAVSLTEQQYLASLRAARAEEERNFILQREVKSISDINERISALRSKLDSLPKTGKGIAAEWTATGREIQKATAKLAEFEAKYNKVTTKPGSINRISAEMQALTDKWNAMSKAQKFDKDGNLKASAQRVVDKFRELTIESEKFGRSLAETAKAGAVETRKIGDNVRDVNAEMGRSNSHLMTLIKNSARLIALHAATRFVRNIREVTAEFELQRVALGSIIQDTEKAESLFKQIKAAAVQSPFEIKDLVTYTKQLSAYQIETEKLFDTTMKLADISSGLGVDMGRLILAFGQVRAAAVLRGQELRQFTEAGIPLVDKLAQKLSELNGRAVSTAEVFELISKRAVPFAMIEEIFNDLTSAGGAFYKMQEKQAETLLGQWNNLKDAISIMYDEIGNTTPVHSAMEDLISGAKTLMQNWRFVGNMVAWTAVQYGVMKGATAFLPILVRDTKLLERAELAEARAKRLQEAAHASGSKLLAKFAQSLRAYTYYIIMAARATTGFGRALNLTKAFFVKNWVGLAVTAVTLLTSALVSARIEASRLQKELAKIGSEGLIKADQSVRNFERLAKAAVGAAAGSKEQKDAVDELVRTYGDLLPASDKVVEKLISMKGNYDSLTEAIRQKINMQIREQKIDTITSEYSKKIGGKQDRLKKLLKEEGLSTAEISAVMAQLQTAVNDGLVNTEQDIEEQAQAIEKIIYEYTGKYVKLLESFYQYGSYYQGEKATPLSRNFGSLVGLWSDMNDAIQEVDDSMAGSIGVIGKYASEWKDLQKEIANYAGVGKTQFARSEDEIRNRVERSIKFIQDKFKDANVDISQAIVNGVPKFDIIKSLADQIEDSSAATSLRSIVGDFQKTYEKLELSDDLRNAIKSKLMDISESTGISMDKFTSYIKAAGADSKAYIKEIEDAITKYRDDAQETANLIAQGAPADTSENRAKVKEYNDMADALQVLFDWLSKIIKVQSTPPKKDPLTNLRQGISDITNAYKKFIDLRKYMGKEAALENIATFFPSLEGWEPTYENMLKRLDDMLKQYKGNADATRLKQQAIANIKFDQIKKTLEDKLKKLSDEIKRSETARNFYKDIFDLTGDEDLATSLSVSVYGDVGSDFKERLQQELNALFDDVTVDDAMRKAIDTQDWDYIFEHLPDGLEELRKELTRLRNAQQKFSTDQIKTWLNDLKKEKTYAEQRIALARKTQEEIAKINETVSDPQVRHELTMKYLKREQEEAAKLRYEAFKGSPLYVEMFGDLENATEGTLRTMRESVSEFMEQWKELKPTELKEMQSRLQEIDAQLAKKNPFKTLSDAIEEYNSLLDSGRTRNMDTQILVGRNIALGQAQDRLDKLVEQQKKAEDDYELAKKSNALDSEAVQNAKDKVNELKAQVAEQQAIVDQTQEMADEAARNAAQWKLIDRRVALARAEIEEYASVIKQLGSVVKDAFSLFVGDDAASTVGQIAEMFDTLTSSLKSIASAAARAELGDVAGAITGGAQGVVGIATLAIQFAKLIESLRMKKFNDALESQDEIIKRLESSYGRLEKKMAKAFGNEYAYYYTAAIEELQAKYEAYLAQIAIKNEEAQKASGKENKEAARKEADELKHTAEEVLDEMDAMKEKLANFYAGTDLTSAAQEFAEAWLDAYQQFGSTTQAIKEKMQDMINSLIVKTALAGAAQAVLGPFFEDLEEMAGKKGGMTYKDIAEVVGTLQGSVGDMNAVLSSVMQVLRANGIDVRNTVGSFKGVAHEVATASEESILALAAGINTQNFYMASINANVQQIVTMLSGGAARDVAPQSAPAAAGALSVQELMNTHLPSIRYDIAEIRSMLSDVIKSAGAPATKYVATKM